MTDTSSAEFFEAKYRTAEDADPWQFASAAYEQQRYDAILYALSGRRYQCAFEPACSVGVLTARLASLCDQVIACDFSETAVAAAQARCAQLPNVTVRCRALTAEETWSSYDLITLCEIGYYFAADEWRHLVDRMVNGMQPGTVLLASHWLGTSADHVQGGSAVHQALQHPLLAQSLHERHEHQNGGFLLERWTRIA